MKLAHLYVNAAGKEVRSHSYSAGDTLKFCPQKYKLQKLDGWKEREQRASLQFGIALESALRYHHENKFSGGPEEFARLWEVHRNNAELKYKGPENSWEDLAKTGVEMVRLYHLRLPLSPIDTAAPVSFQVKFWKELFPGTELAGLEFVAYVDMIARDKDEFGGTRFWDIKTSSMPIDQTLGIISLDQQLRTYSWVTGYADGGFIWFQKVGRGLSRGDRVALLATIDTYYAGSSAVIVKYQEYEPAQPVDPEKPKSKPKPEIPEELWIVKDETAIEAMFTECGRGQKKEEKEARDIWIKLHAILVPSIFITKQRLSFVTASFSQEEQMEASKMIGQDVAQIVSYNADNFWPKQGGVRFPNNKCTMCPMRGICLDNRELRDQYVMRSDSEWDVVAPESDQEND